MIKNLPGKVLMCGGPHPMNGRWLECAGGIEIRFPFVDSKWNDEMCEWDSKYLLADVMAYLDRDFDTLNKIPPKPTMPCVVYRWERPYGGDTVIGVFDRIER